MVDWKLLGLLVAWVAAATMIGIVRHRHKALGVGLVPAYILSLASIHWLGAAVYLAPAFSYRDPTVMLVGFEQSTYGVLAFVLGSLAGWPLISSTARRTRPVDATAPLDDPRVAGTYALLGVLCYGAAVTGLSVVPTLSAVVNAGQQLMVLALCLAAWHAWRRASSGALVTTLAVTACLPIVTIVVQGYLSYGAAAAVIVCAFVASFYRPRRRLVLAAVAVAYVALSFFVSYMRDRSEIRQAVWGGRPVDERLAQTVETVATLELFDPSEPRHLDAVDARLNQNYLVGLAVERMRWTGDFAGGATLGQALLALVPRVVWPDKPYAAGSGDIVATYTGLRFARETSVGIGQVMEFYVNFGVLGVLGGFFLTGIVVTGLDEAAARRLYAGEWWRFAPRALVGFSLLQVGGALAEVVTTAAACLVAATFATQLHDSWIRRRPAATAAVTGSPAIHGARR